jgi:hypothetical protein
MIFSCYPPSSKCEWSIIYRFVEEFNSLNGTSYKLSKCLDVEYRESKQPEVLLKSIGHIPMVVERKTVVWPKNYFSDHMNFHYFFEKVIKMINSLFQDKVYKLKIIERSIKNKKKNEINDIADKIARKIKINIDKAKSPLGIKDKEPIPWNFHQLSPHEIEDNYPKKGIVFFQIKEFNINDANAKRGFAEEFKKVIDSTAKKFKSYKKYLKVLLVQFHGEDSFPVDEEIVIHEAKLPELIDQIWIAEPDWINEYDYMITWKLVRDQNV